MDPPWISIFLTASCLVSVQTGLAETAVGPRSVGVRLQYETLSDLSLVCEVEGEATGEVEGEVLSVQYEVTWYRKGINISSSLLPPALFTHTLHNITSADLVDKIEYHCEARACYETVCSQSVFSNETTSTPYAPQLQVVAADNLTVREGGEWAQIQVVLTAPPTILCIVAGQVEDCRVKVMATVEDQNPLPCASANQKAVPQLLFPELAKSGQSQFCITSFSMETWSDVTNITVAANQDMRFESSTKSIVSLSLVVGGDLKSFRQQQVTIEVLDSERPQSVCSSLSTLHLKTFDNKYYDLRQAGEFVLFKNVPYDYEVHTFSTACAGVSDRSTCTCAVAVRVQADVIVFSGCQAGQRVKLEFFGIGGQLKPRVYRRNGGNSYEVLMMSGSRLLVREGEDNYLDVWLYASPLDWNSTQGLCGNYDGQTDNDLMTPDGKTISPAQIANLWRVDKADSLYNGVCPDKVTHLSIQTERHCSCESVDTSVCLSDFGVQTCHMLAEYRDGVTDYDITEDLLAATSPPRNCFDGFQHHNVFQFKNPEEDTGEWIDGWNETYARDICITALQESSIYQTCLEVIQPSVEHIDNCATDIRLSGMREQAERWVGVLETDCVHQLETNTTLQHLYGANKLLATICPSACSNNGNCFRGECECEDGFMGVDCSLSIYDEPVIKRLSYDGLCNNVLFECKSVHIFGETFVETPQLKAYYKTIQVTDNGYDETGEWTECVQTHFINSGDIVCDLPDTNNYLIRASNILNVFSNTSLFLAFNPQCYQCDSVLGTCSIKDERCVIEGECYLDLSLHPDTHTKICNSADNNKEWSDNIRPCPGSEVKWIEHESKAVAFHNHKTVNESSKSTCQELCLEETEFRCRSVDYKADEQLCHLSKFRAAQVGQYYQRYPAFIYMEWHCLQERCPEAVTFWTSRVDMVPESIEQELTDVWTPDHCQQLCLSSNTCYSAVWNPQNGLCLLSPQDVPLSQDLLSVQAPGWTTFSLTCQQESPADRGGVSVKQVGIKPNFTGPGQDSFKAEFTLTSSADQSKEVSSEKEVAYSVLWKVDGEWLGESTEPESHVQQFLDTNLANTIKSGTTLSAAVSACYAKDCENTRGVLVSSELYTAQIKMDNALPTMILKEGEAGETIKIQATAPPYVLCRNQTFQDSDSCQILLTYNLTLGDSEDLFCLSGEIIHQVALKLIAAGEDVALCGLTITMNNWETPYELNVKATTDMKYEEDQTRTLTLGTEFLVNSQLQQQEDLLISELTIVNMDRGGLCMAVNDPHITTFDSVYYHHYPLGPFILYQHTELPYMVQIFMRNCPNRMSCTTAVAVRAGDDVVVIDFGGAELTNTSNPITIKLYRNGALTPGFRIFNRDEGRMYIILFPTGTEVRVGISVIPGYNFLNVWLLPSAADVNSTRGLCGKYNFDASDDLTDSEDHVHELDTKPDQFSQTWRVEEKDSLYTGFCSEDLSGTGEEQPTYCYCRPDLTHDCGTSHHLTLCPQDFLGDDITKQLVDNSLYPTKCLETESLFTHPEFQYPSGGDSIKEYGWDQAIGMGWSVYNVKETKCRAAMMEPEFVRSCINIPGVNFENSLISCVEDIKNTLDVQWPMAAREDVKKQCEIALQTNTSLWQSAPGLLTQQCPSECRGSPCVNGVCQCITNRDSLDCVVETNKPPNLFFISGNGLCDLRINKCDTVNIFNNNTLNSTDLTCHWARVKLNETGFETDTELENTTVTFIHLMEMSCPVPTSGFSYQVSVSYQEQESTALLYLVYDSLCQTCYPNNGTCVDKSSGCVIDERCYEDGEFNPTNRRQFCDVTTNRTEWQHANDSCEGLQLVWYRQRGHQLAGFQEDKIGGDVESCKQACLEHHSTLYTCSSFNYDTISNVCTLNTQDKRSHINSLVESVGIDYYEWQCDNNPGGKSKLTFKRKPGYAVLGQDEKRVLNIFLLTECRTLCLLETNFVCRSFELLREAGLCTLSSITSLEAGVGLVRWSGYVFEEWALNDGKNNLMIPQNPRAWITELPDSTNLTLACSFPTLADDQVAYILEWIIDEDIVDWTIPRVYTEGTHLAYLDTVYLAKLQYGSQVACIVTACQQNSCSETRGALRRSNVLELIVQVEGDSVIQLSEGQAGYELKMRSQVPPAFLCESGDCSIVVRVQLEGDEADNVCESGAGVQQVVVKGAQCGVTFESDNWWQQQSVWVKAKVDGLYDGNQNRTLQFFYQTSSPDAVSQLQYFQSFNLEVEDRDQPAVCGVNYPDVHTADGFNYQLYDQGQFVLYQHATLPYQVHVLIQSEVCGVLVRSGDDIIVLDRCEGSKLKVQVHQNGELTPGTTIHSMAGGLKLMVRLPTGTVVSILLNRQSTDLYMDVSISLSAVDFNNTQGLCGNYDMDAYNDLVMRNGLLYDRPGNRPQDFTQSWRAQQDWWYMEGFCDEDLAEMDYPGYCNCPTDTEVCGSALDIVACPGANSKWDVTGWVSQSPDSKATRCSTKVTLTEATKPLYDEDYVPPVYGWPTASNRTEEEAMELCNSALNSTEALNRCVNIMPALFDWLLKSCIHRIQMTDKVMWADVARVSLADACIQELKQDISLWVEQDQLVRPDIQAIAAVQDCRISDSCSTCEEGQGGSDCLITLNQPPTISGVLDGGLCDVSRQSCDGVMLFGGLFTSRLLCHLQPIELGEGDYMPVGEEVSVTGVLVTYNQVVCPLPTPSSHLISISNNNVNRSRPFTFTVFHGQCQQCERSGQCTFTRDTCLIDNKCYEFGERNNENDTQVCNPYESYSHWSPYRAYPYLKTEPSLRGVHIHETDHFMFECTFNLSQRTDVIYNISWYHNEDRVSEVNIDDISVHTYSIDINFIKDLAFNSKITCGVSACFPEDCENTISPVKISPEFVAGLKIHTEQIKVQEGAAGMDVEISLTVPTRYFCTTESCSLRVQVGLTPGSESVLCPGSDRPVHQLVYLTDASEQDCYLDGLEWGSLLRVPLAAVSDQLVDGERVWNLQLSAVVHADGAEVFSGPATSAKVLAEDRDSPSLCHATPHITTFDGDSVNTYTEGVFNLYRHRRLPYEVQVFQRHDNDSNHVPCVCAVGIRSGDDVILIDRCIRNDRQVASMVTLFLNGRLTPNTRVLSMNEGRSKEVHLPIGTYVSVWDVLGSECLDVWVKPSAQDYQHTDGLCGSYDGDKSNDRAGGEEFSISWRVKMNEDFLSGICEEEEKQEETPASCLCDESNTCRDTSVHTCSTQLGEDMTEFYVQHASSPRGCPGQLTEKLVFLYSEEYIQVAQPWPTVVLGYGKSDAMDYCTDFILTSEVQTQCSGVVSIDIQRSIVDACVADIQIQDSLVSAVFHRMHFLFQCYTHLSVETGLWVLQGGLLGPPNSILNLLCVNDCSGNGICNAGVCVCDGEFAGADCSVNTTLGPKLGYVLPSGQCDNRQSDCLALTVVGAHFLPGPNTVCRMERFKYDGAMFVNSWEVLDVLDVLAVFVSHEVVICVVSAEEAGSFRVSVGSNETDIFSTETVFFTVIDSECINATGDNYILVDNYCFIDTRCYKTGDIRADNPNLVCDVSRSVVQWTDKTDFPDIGVVPTLSVRVEDELFVLQCDWKGYVENSTISLSSQWMLNNQLMPSLQQDVQSGHTNTTISHTDILALKYGDTVQCGLLACLTDDCEDTRAPVVTSNEFTFEIKLMTLMMLTIEEGQDAKAVWLQPTFPPFVLCETPDCNLTISASIQHPKPAVTCPQSGVQVPQAVLGWVGTTGCQLELRRDNWEKEQTLLVRAVTDGLVDGDQFQSLDISLSLPTGDSLTLETVQLTIRDEDRSAMCKAINVPHITTFDKVQYNLLQYGEFTLYQHSTLPFAVHLFLGPCRGLLPCVCGAAVLVDDDVFVVDRCRDNKEEEELRLEILRNGDLVPGTRFMELNDGREYQVLIPTGTRVSISMGQGARHLNVWLTASAADWRRTDGLCGTFDGDQDNDLTDRDGNIASWEKYPTTFSETWRVRRDVSLYQGVCQSPAPLPAPPSLCECSQHSNSSCALNGYLYNCQEELLAAQAGEDITEMLLNRSHDQPPMCQGLGLNVFMHDEFTLKPVNWPTVSGWTEVTALERCKTYLQSQAAVHVCLNTVVSIQLDLIIQGCVDSIQVLDSDVLLNLFLDSLVVECRYEVEINRRYWQHVDGVPFFNLDIVSAFCPSNCNGRGTCINGACRCEPTYGGRDCSVVLTEPPRVIGVRDGGLCDLAAGQCSSEIILFGDNFLNSDRLMCFFKQVKVLSTGLQVSDTQVSVHANFINYRTVMCSLPAPGSYSLSISNNGVVYSRTVTLLVLNSACVTSNRDGLVIFQGDKCFIENMCYDADAENPNNSTLVCQPALNQTEWSPKPDFPTVREPMLETETLEAAPWFRAVCRFQMEAGVRYIVEWSAGVDSVTDQGPFDEGLSFLDADQLTSFTIGDDLRCAVKGCYRLQCESTMSPLRYSPALTAKVHTDKSDIVIVEGQDAHILKVMSTLPPVFFCRNLTIWSDCHIVVSAGLVPGREVTCAGSTVVQAVIGHEEDEDISVPCGRRITSSNWNTGVFISVKAKIDSPLRDKHQIRTMKIQSQVMIGEVSVGDSSLQEIQVTIKDADMKAVCSSLNDPHITTVDGKKYNNHFEGEFTFYLNKKRDYEVHTLYQKCADGKRASCNCGVAVRALDDVIVFDRCTRPGSKRNPLLIRSYITGQLTPGVKIIKFGGGRKYKVCFPTGTCVEIRTGARKQSKFINVWLYPSVDDYESMEGLCGTFDGDKSNDLMMSDGVLSPETGSLPTRFASSWRSTTSYYDGYCGEEEGEALAAPGLYCDCVDGLEVVCSRGRDVFDCGVDETKSRKIKKGQDVTQQFISRAVTPRKCFQLGFIEFTFLFDLDFKLPELTWPTAEGISESEAYNYCASHILDSAISVKCNNVPLIELDFNQTVRFCMDDIQITGDIEWRTTALGSFITQCQTEISTRLELMVEVEGQLVALPEVDNIICINSCSGNGICKDGECECSEGWLGEDCSINGSAPPLVSELEVALCDLGETQSCLHILIIGDNFVDLDTLTCRVQHLEMGCVSDTDAKTYTVPAVYISNELVQCDLEMATSVRISISNIIDLYSTELNYTVTNSACELYSDSSCTPREDVCNIGNECFECGDVFVDDPTRYCNPSNNNTAWTIVQENIKAQRYRFQSVSGSKLTTSVLDLLVTGSPSLMEAETGGQALLLSGNSQSISFPDSTSKEYDMLSSPGLCSIGFLLKFEVRFNSFCENMYILTTGGDQAEYTGVSVSYRKRAVYFTVSTENRQWVLRVPNPQKNLLYKYRFGFNKRTGIDLMVGDKTYNTKMFYKRALKATEKGSLKIGGPFSDTDGCYADIIFGGLELYKASPLILQVLNVVTELPVLEKMPVLSVNEEDNRAMFRCSLEPLGRGDVTYRVDWIVEGTTLHTEDLNSSTQYTLLSEEVYANWEYGVQLECQVTVCYSFDCNSTLGPSLKSKILTLAVHVKEKSLMLAEGGSESFLTVLTSVPPHLLCPVEHRGNNTIVQVTGAFSDFRAEQMVCPQGNSLNQAVIGIPQGDDTQCGGRVVRWNDALHIPVRASVDGVRDGDAVGLLFLNVTITCTENHNFTQQLAQIQVKVEDKDEVKICRSVNDPHITTFDLTKYDNFKLGEFVLYKHTVLPYEVHARFDKCNNVASCNCGVAVKVDDDVIVINQCGSSKNPPLRVKVYKNGRMTSGVKVTRHNGDKKFRISLPTGTSVDIIKDRKKFFNVLIRSSPADFNHTQGLCGSYDGDKSNDLMRPDGTIYKGRSKYPNSFSDSWRVGVDDSIFDGYCPEEEEDAQHIYCDCQAGLEPVCSHSMFVVDCAPPKQTKTSGRKRYKDMTIELLREATEPRKCVNPNEREIFEYDLDYVSPEPIWPTRTGLELKDVEAYCVQIIEASFAAKSCLAVLDFSIDLAIENCILDIQLTSDLDWALTMKENIESECTLSLEFTISLWVSASGIFTLPPIYAAICPDDCSGNGYCDEGICVCNGNFIGEDCSILASQPPSLQQISTGHFCSLLVQDCTEVLIEGENFVDSEDLVCHLTKLVIEDNVFVRSSDKAVSIQGTFISANSVLCQLEAANRYTIAVSNNGADVSNELFYIPFDLRCENCIDTTCYRRVDVCVINSLCYESGAVNPDNRQQVCEPSTSTDTWGTLSVTKITVFRYFFERIVGSLLVTRSFNFTLIGKPIFTQGPRGGNAIQLNGVDQAIDYGDLAGTCLGDLESCDLGLTISFDLLLLEFRNNMYILSGGGDDEETYGVSMWWRGNRLYLRLSTSKYEWSCKVKYDRKYSAFLKLQFSWSLQTGLRLFVDGDLADKDDKPKKVKYHGKNTNKFYICRRYSKAEFTAAVISNWNVVYAERDIVKDFDLDIELPEIESTPDLVVMGNESRVELSCSVEALDRPSLEYHVEWLLNENSIAVGLLAKVEDRLKAYLGEEKIEKMKLGDKREDVHKKRRNGTRKNSSSPCILMHH